MELYTLCVYALAGIAGIGILIQGIGLAGLLVFRIYSSPKRNKLDSFPGISIIKPCYTSLDNEEENFDSFFNQDYRGPIQLIFVVSESSDPIVPVIQRFLARYPHHDAELVISKTRKAYWQKIDALYDAHKRVKHELVIWSDSDTIIKSDYVSQMSACLQEPGVSVVTTPQYDARVNNFATALKTLGNNCDVACYVMIYYLFSRKKPAAWGHSLGFKRSEFKEFEAEAWSTLSNSFADDLILPILFTKYGKKVVFRNIYCPVQYSNKSLRGMITQQERFAICQKAFIGRWVYFSGMLVLPLFPATLLLLVAPFHPISFPIFFSVIGARVFLSFLFELLILKSCRMNLRYFWTIPIWDLLRIYFMTYAVFHSTVDYHGKRYRFIGRFQLEEVKENPTGNDQNIGWAQRGTDSASFHSPV